MEQSFRDAAGSTFQSRVFADYEAVHAAPGRYSASGAAWSCVLIKKVRWPASSSSPTPSRVPSNLCPSPAFSPARVSLAWTAMRKRPATCSARAAATSLSTPWMRLCASSRTRLRQRKPVAVCLTGEVPSLLQEMAGPRRRSPVAVPRPLRAGVSRNHPTAGFTERCSARPHNLGGLLNRPPNADGELTQWTLPRGNCRLACSRRRRCAGGPSGKRP